MTEAQWLACEDAQEMCWYLGSFRGQFKAIHGKAGRRKLRLVGCASCRQVWDAMTDARSRAAVEYAERLADGKVDAGRLNALRYDADQAVLDAGFYRQTGRIDSDAPGTRAALAAACAVSEEPPACVHSHWAMRRNVKAEDATAHREWRGGHRELARLLRDIFGNPFRPVAFSPEWRTSTAVAIASEMYESREFSAMPILADALQDTGCDNADILDHCRGGGPHVRGCWVVDLLLGKE